MPSGESPVTPLKLILLSEDPTVPTVKVPVILKFLILLISILESTIRALLADAVPGVTPDTEPSTAAENAVPPKVNVPEQVILAATIVDEDPANVNVEFIAEEDTKFNESTNTPLKTDEKNNPPA